MPLVLDRFAALSGRRLLLSLAQHVQDPLAHCLSCADSPRSYSSVSSPRRTTIITFTMESSTKNLILVSSDGIEFELPVAAAALSEYVLNACGRGTEDDENDFEHESEFENVDVLRVSSGALSKVVDFLKHYKEEPMKGIPTPLGASTFDEVMDQKWYQTFTAEDNMPRELLFEVLTAANFMTIKPLLDLCCLKVTFQLTNKSAEEIREILNLPDLTAEEEAQAREEHRWIFEDTTN